MIHRVMRATNENGTTTTVRVSHDDMRESPSEFLDGLNVFIEMKGGRYLPSIDMAPNTEEARELTRAPLTAYIHGRVALAIDGSGYPFSVPFDSGKCGYVWYKDEADRKGLERVVEALQDLINGDVYLVEVGGEDGMSCGGVLDSDIEELATDMARDVLGGSTIVLEEVD